MKPVNLRIFGGVVAIVIIGVLLRVHHLDIRTLTHPEFYIPGLEIPRYVTHPNERLTVSEVMVTPLKYHHPHLPGFDVFMLGWTSLLGTNLFALRMSSVLGGSLLILAVFWFAREFKDNRTALLASAIVAAHGYHIHWSQLAKQWAWLALLGVFSSFLIARTARSGRNATAFLYLAVSAFGLWIDSYYWPVMAAQMFWVLCTEPRSERTLSLLQIQIIALILAAGALPYLLGFSGSRSHLPQALWPRILEMAQFGGIVIQESSVKPSLLIKFLIGLAGALLFFLGLKGDRNAEPSLEDLKSPDQRWIFGLTVLALFASISAIWFIFLNQDLIYRRKSFAIGVGSSVLFFLLGDFIRWKWGLISNLVVKAKDSCHLRASAPNLSTVMAILPFSLLMPIHFLNPVLTPYALVSFSPFFIVAMSHGVFAFGRRTQVILIGGIFLLCLFSIHQSANIPNPKDYQELASKLRPELQAGDVLIIENRWYSVPIIYYFPPSHFFLRPVAALIGPNTDSDASAAGHTRFWFVDFPTGSKPGKRFLEKERVLSSILKRVKQVEGGNGIAILFQSNEPRSILPDQLHYPDIKPFRSVLTP